jgi:hypothetical protein
MKCHPLCLKAARFVRGNQDPLTIKRARANINKRSAMRALCLPPRPLYELLVAVGAGVVHAPSI